MTGEEIEEKLEHGHKPAKKQEHSSCKHITRKRTAKQNIGNLEILISYSNSFSITKQIS